MGRFATMEAGMSKTQPTTVKLSDSQLVILSTAAQRDDGSLLPFPETLTAKGSALSRVIETLRKRKLVEEKPTANGAPEWRRDEERGRILPCSQRPGVRARNGGAALFAFGVG